jgi:Skp family chaperone for outer membrane proteins
MLIKRPYASKCGSSTTAQDNHDNMMKKLEKGSTVTSSTLQDQLEQDSKKEKGHATSHCPTKLKAQETISKKRRRSTRRKIVLCMQREGTFGCGLHTS